MKIITLSIIILLIITGLYAQERSEIVITSESLSIDNKNHSALFKGSVKAVKNDIIIYADRMLVYYDESGSKVQKIQASGNIKVIRGNQTIASESAVYTSMDERIEFTGNPVATDGKNIIYGDKIEYYISEDRSVVTKSRVFTLEEKK